MGFVVTTMFYYFCLAVVSCGMLANWFAGGSISLDAWNFLAVLWGGGVPFAFVSGLLVYAEVE